MVTPQKIMKLCPMNLFINIMSSKFEHFVIFKAILGIEFRRPVITGVISEQGGDYVDISI